MWFITTLLAALQVSGQNNCTVVGPNGEIIDMSGMYRPASLGDYQGDDQDLTDPYTYRMNICGPCTIGGECTQREGILCQYDPQGGFVNVIAAQLTPPVPSWTLINPSDATKGVELVTANGDLCWETNQQRTTTTAILCDLNAPLDGRFTVFETDTNKCDYHISYSHPSACPLPANLVTLVSGTLVPNQQVYSNQWSYYKIVVPMKVAELKIDLRQFSSSGWLSLFVRLGALPTQAANDYFDNTYGTMFHGLEIRNTDPNPLVEGTYYIGVLAQAGFVSNFSIQAWLYTCPNQCSGHGTCNVGAGICYCNVGWNTNQADCSAPIIDVVPATSYSGLIYGNRYAFYRLTVNDTQAAQLFVQMTRDPTTPSALPTLMIAFNRFPSITDNDGQVGDTSKPSQSWQLSITTPTLVQGEWIIGVYGSRDEIFNYTVKARQCDCPNCCNDHGTCQQALPSDICMCDDGFRGTQDCSTPTYELIPAQFRNVNIEPGMSASFFVEVASDVAVSRSDLQITAIQTNAGDDLVRLYASPNKVPTDQNYRYASALPMGFYSVIVIPHADLGQSMWYFTVYNRGSLTASVTSEVTYDAWCACSNGHGDCDKNATGAVCTCHSGWQGAGCDVSTDPGNGTDEGTVAGVAIVLFIVGLVLGYLVKSYACQPARGEGPSINE